MHEQKKMQINGSDKTIKIMVFQQKKPLDYYSKRLIPIETNYTTGDKKKIAVVVTLKHWRYLTQIKTQNVCTHGT